MLEGPGNPEIRGYKNIQKIRILKIQIRSALNVGKVWISREKNSRASLGGIPGDFLHGPKKKNVPNLPVFLGGPMGPIHPVWALPKWGQEDFFLVIQTLPTFRAERIWLSRIFL